MPASASRFLAVSRRGNGYRFRVFRPCIDLREGKVVQIVGGTLSDSGFGVRTHFVASHPPAWFAARYRADNLRGGHVIALGPGNEAAAREALGAWPGGLQYGGGVTSANAPAWLDAGAERVIVTSWVFREGALDAERLAELVTTVGRERLVLDLSCRKRGDDYFVVTDRWQKFTELRLGPEVFARLAASCSEFLVHAVDVEGLCHGIDGNLVSDLAAWSPVPVTYAGGARSLEDLERVEELGGGRVDLTIGSALDLFGGTGVRYVDAVAFNRSRPQRPRV
ncbi:MAG: phosphoribosylformimino-5-aminoimidazole carboxamide ribotide isomerase [Verrucomicrobiales bacterium]|nr:phosphoribosylformimino-5-aminoimidazole carboxamide ribotide isomerase [Verrucomicrobiales bacterium]